MSVDMIQKSRATDKTTSTKANMFSLLLDYKGQIALLVILSFVANGLSLLVPRIIAKSIDQYGLGQSISQALLIEFLVVSLGVFIFSYIQAIVQNYVSELVAKNFRQDLSQKISQQSYAYIQKIGSAVLLTNLTSDVDAIKNFVGQAFATMVSSVFLIIGASALLLIMDWQLALAVLTIIPVIALIFSMIFKKINPLFMKTRTMIDRLNKVINESILGAALIRVLNSKKYELKKFNQVNSETTNLGLKILNYFATLVPMVSFMASMATLVIILLGGKFVIAGEMSLGNLAAFNSYIFALIHPIIMFSFMSNVISRSSASYARVFKVLADQTTATTGKIPARLSGEIELKHVSRWHDDHNVLKDVSLKIKPGTKTAIVGPTGGGKTQLLYTLSGLTQADQGQILYSGININDYDKNSFYQQLALVFQDSSIFNLTLRENISFSPHATDQALQKAIATAELDNFIEALPNKLNTVVSERGTSMSGGQKQRVMLARALAINPKILLLDDFTARVDARTEKAILENLKNNYPQLTLISVTQKIASISDYDQIILLMEGEVIAAGKHQELLNTSPEYVQLFNSQQSTENL